MMREKYESHHNVKITYEAIVAAVDLSIRYITDRFLPDKAARGVQQYTPSEMLDALT